MVSTTGSGQPQPAAVVSEEKSMTEPTGPSQEFSGTIKVSQKPPTRRDLEKIADLPVLNSEGESRTFKSLHSDPEHPNSRTLIIFIRHFFCGNCQEYLRTLCSSVSPSSLAALSPPINIVVIGCGSPELISFYADASSCHFPIFADPTRRLYESLHMISTKSLGPKRPEYQQRSLLSISLESIYQGLSRGRHAFKGGDFWQVGGEFLIEDGETLWCHRMSSTRDHTEVPELRKILGLDEARVPLRVKRRGTGNGNGSVKRGLSFRSSSWRSRSRGAGKKGSRERSVEGEEEKENRADSGRGSAEDAKA